MKTLLETLGTEAALRFLSAALPQFEQRSEELLAHLRAGSWQEAASCAHRLKGTIHLYGAPGLQEQLNQLSTKNPEIILNNYFLAEMEKKINDTKKIMKSFISNS